MAMGDFVRVPMDEWQFTRLLDNTPPGRFAPKAALKNYVRDRGMSGLGWIGHVGLGQDEEYYGSDDAGNDYYISDSTGGIVNSDGQPVVPSGPLYNDSGALVSGSAGDQPVPFGPPAAEGPPPPPGAAGAAAGTGQTYYGVDSKGRDIWVNSQGQYVNQDGLRITPAAGTLQVEGGGTTNIPAGAVSTTQTAAAGTAIGASVLPALLAPGPAPRVTVPAAASSSFLTASSIVPGVSNMLILGGGLLALVLLMGKK